MTFLVARAEKHMWEEPVISGIAGSGTIFFGGCSLRCVYCQNHEISHKLKALRITENQLISLMLDLQSRGAHNINLVTPSHYAAALVPVLTKAKTKLNIPVIYNSSGYDKLADLQMLNGLIDVYLPDLKYFDGGLSQKYSGKEDYFSVASDAISEMHRQQPCNCFVDGLIKRGLIVRHLVLPNCTLDSLRVLDFLAKIDKGIYVSVMSQYFPTANVQNYPELNRRISSAEYDTVRRHFFKIGLHNGFMQDLSSAIHDYVPEFDLEKLKIDIIKAGSKFCELRH